MKPNVVILFNIRGVQNLIDAVKETNIHLVHISTDFIYDGNEEEYFEDSLANPLNYYGLSKWKSEQLFEDVNFSIHYISNCISLWCLR